LRGKNKCLKNFNPREKKKPFRMCRERTSDGITGKKSMNFTNRRGGLQGLAAGIDFIRGSLRFWVI